MGFNNPFWSWSELESTLSDRAPTPRAPRTGRDGRAPGSPSWNAGGDGPAWSRKRQPFETPHDLADTGSHPAAVPYAELHCHSNFSFLDGASHPEALATEAARLGLDALALTDHNGFYGVVRFAEAAKAVGVSTVFGAEITLTARADGRLLDGRVARSEAATDRQVDTGLVPDSHAPDPAGTHLVVLADGPRGYARLSRVLSEGHLAGEKGAPQFAFDDLVAGLADGSSCQGWVLTGCRKGAVPAALVSDGVDAARRELERLVDAFGRDRVLVELWDHGDPVDSARNDGLYELARRVGVGCVATNNVHYATPAQRRLATAVAAVRARRSLSDLDAWLPSSAGAHLRSGAEQAARFARFPGAVEMAAAVGSAAAFDLSLVAPNLPPFPCPTRADGTRLTEMEYLREIVAEGARRRYGDRPGPGEDLSLRARAWATIDHELALIEQLDFAGYFLIVWDLVEFCRRSNIYCQGRGSAANSAVCYALGVTAADAVSLGLLFERFLSPERDGPPDIDIDIESDRREEVIQYVYATYGRHHTAQVANVITYRSRSAIRDMAKALGYEPGQQDAWAKEVDAWGNVAATAAQDDCTIPPAVLELAAEVEDAPRHLGIHSGGMVICDRPVIEVCPVEWGRMDQRSVLQWDKDDCAASGLVKFDLLGLGMLSALHYAVDLVEEHRGYQIDLATLPQDDDVYAMLCRADTVGVFQIESRAQMATLPRLKPRKFYDLVVEVALIRPGPIQGGSVHPYIRRRNGQEQVTYLHPLLENSLAKTLGVPLFQEQMMQMAIDIAGFTPAESDELRQAMGSKRSARRMEALRLRLYEGMERNGITGDIADQLYVKLKAFANYGFPESHSVSFAYLVYASSWIKHYEPAAFCAALLNAQPMGFWSPHSLVQDARRHGVVVHTPDLNASRSVATLEPCAESLGSTARPVAHGFATAPAVDRSLGEGLAVRLGLSSVRGVGGALADEIEAERTRHGAYVDTEDLVRRVPSLTLAQLEAMATAGVFAECFGLGRREALWAVGATAQSRPGRLAGIVTGADAPRLPGMTPVEEAIADLWATGVSPEGHPTIFVRRHLEELGVSTSRQLWDLEPGSTVRIAGVVTHRQRPMTAQGTTFLNLEDEFGLMNVVVSKGCWARFRKVARGAPAMLIRGRLERSEGVINVVADHLAPLPLPGKTASRDFR
ncbi:MAG: error-prone DNA polymerase [Ilumatobacter sp.]|uniref:error-prone DNA polymerase n=1 Tax=Ilumatobacter sp. TaxID=1967498 RepID=UPI00391BF5B3